MNRRAPFDVLADLAALASRQSALTAELAEALRAAPAPALLPVSEGAPEYLTTAEAAGELGVSERHLKALRAEGRGPAFLRVGRSVRYPRATLAQNAVQFPSGASRPAPSSAAKSR